MSRPVASGRRLSANGTPVTGKTVLPNLTAEDLKDLGVSALGHRRKLLDRIAALRSTPR